MRLSGSEGGGSCGEGPWDNHKAAQRNGRNATADLIISNSLFRKGRQGGGSQWSVAAEKAGEAGGKKFLFHDGETGVNLA